MQLDTNRPYLSSVYPPGSKSKALRLGVHLILLYVIRISHSPEEFFFILSVVGGVQLFWSLIFFIIIWQIL